MAESSNFLAETRYAVVTGANKGIGLEICRQLASKGVVVLLTSRDGKRGLQAHENLIKSGISPENLHFHQLDVTDVTSIAPLVGFINSKFGKLDILVNNAGITGAMPGAQINHEEMMTQTYELTKECLETNYYGVKRTTEALLPLLKLSNSPRIINTVREILGDAESLTEERIDEILSEFLRDFQDGSFKEKGWPKIMAAYIVSKVALSAYTRILAKKNPSVMINCICPGFIRTDMNGNMGHLSVEEGAASPVRLALMPQISPSGLFYVRNEVSSFE
ncbi:(+)-neomenthol dehydrogenase [Bienertia sinuspersici]